MQAGISENVNIVELNYCFVHGKDHNSIGLPHPYDSPVCLDLIWLVRVISGY
jgi:hypothetical protein